MLNKNAVKANARNATNQKISKTLISNMKKSNKKCRVPARSFDAVDPGLRRGDARGVGSTKGFPKTLLGFYMSTVRANRWLAAVWISLGVMTTTIGIIVYPFVNGQVFSIFDYTGPDFWGYVMHIMLLCLGAYFIPRPIQIAYRMISNKNIMRIRLGAARVLYDNVYQSDYQFFIDKNPGSIQSHVRNITNPLHNLTIKLASDIIGQVVGLGILFLMLRGINLSVAVFILGFGALTMVWHLAVMRHRARLSAARTEVHSKLEGTVSDSILNFINVKLFSQQKYEQEYVDGDRKDYMKKAWRDYRFGIIDSHLHWAALNLLWLVLVLFCVYLFYKGSLNVSGFALILAAQNAFERHFKTMGMMIEDTVKNWAEAKQAWNELITPQTVTDTPGAKALTIRRGSVELRDVSFQYGKDAPSKGKELPRWVVKDLSLVIKPGERVGVVGMSGAGKTTLSYLLLRLFDVQEGGIYIDDKNIKSVTQDSLRAGIAFVPQEPVLFNRTIRENIGYARPNAKNVEIERAARLANIHDFITTLPDGYETMVGNRGIKLSGGQKQRVAIARAILKDSKILILDEATSALDSKTEAEIQKSMDVLMRGRTVIAIAHRLSTLAKMNRIVVMENGRIIEAGSHAALLKKGGVYAKLWKMQSG